MPGTIIVPADLWAQARAHVMGPGHYAFLLAGVGKTPDGVRLTVNKVLPVMVGEHDWDSDHRNISLDALLRVINEAKRTSHALIDMHSHDWPGSVDFSHTDRRGIADFAAYMLDAMPGTPAAAIVVNADHADAVWYMKPGERRTDIRIVVEGVPRRVLTAAPSLEEPNDDRFVRQAVEGFLGQAGQRRLRDATVAVVGVSGLGSHVAQQLAYLGVGHIVLIEPQLIENSNLNRLVGAGRDDVGVAKADIVARELRRICGPDITVTVVKRDIRHPEARRAVAGADLMVGCVDNDGARLVLNRYAVAHGIPYVDAASGIDSPEGVFERAGGHVAVVLPGGPCYNCMGLLDAGEARYFLKPEAEQAEDRRLGYAHGWDEPSPSVVALNGVVASAAVSEAMCYLTGFAAPNPLTNYYLRQPNVGHQQMVRQRVERDPDCMSCTYAGLGDAVPPA